MTTRSSERVQIEDAIKHLYGYQLKGRVLTPESLAGLIGVSGGRAVRLLDRLAEMGLIRTQRDEFVLTELGQQSALRLVRSHRLWERYLADRTGVPPEEWHSQAERMEHALSTEDVEELASSLGHPTYDPHGDPIPTASGDLPPPMGVTLAGVDVGQTVEIIEIEDEPIEVFEDLRKRGLNLHGQLRVVERSDTAIRVSVGEEVVTLGPVAARNVTVRAVPPTEVERRGTEMLVDVPREETATVIGISPACQGAQRRRLMDLGIVPGTEITPELVSSGGDPIAYRIRGALIALRRSQAASVSVERRPHGERANA